MTLSSTIEETTTHALGHDSINKRSSFSEDAFRRMLLIERKRTERSGYSFLLMLIDVGNHQAKDTKSKGIHSMITPLVHSTRETDIIGWYKDQMTIGAIFTGLESENKNLILEAILTRVNNVLRDNLTPEQFDQVSITVHFFPDDWDVPHRTIDSALFPDLSTHRAVGQEAVAEDVGMLAALSTQPPAPQQFQMRMANVSQSDRNVI